MGFSTEAAGQYIKGASSMAAGDTRANLENANAEIASQQAKSEVDAGGYNANLARERTAKTEGAQISAIGANNLQQGGTPSTVVSDTARAGEMNALQINNNALRRAWGFQVQGASDTFQAGLAQQGGILSGIGSDIAAGGDIYRGVNQK
jgi:hypothetical protein